jgi:hypothetical protein
MKIEYALPCGRGSPRRAFATDSESEPQGRPPRIARLLALAHRLEGLVRSGTVRDYAELARLGHVSAARLSQIMLLLHLAPAIQEHILFLSPDEARFITESALRRIGREVRWDRQRTSFERLRRGE